MEITLEIPVRGGSCCGVEGSAVLWSFWSLWSPWPLRSARAEALASGMSLFLRVPGARIPVRDGLCCGVEGSAVLWSLWSPLESWTSAVDTRKQSIVQGLHVGSKGTQRDDRKRHLLLCRGVCSCRIHVECYFLMNFYSFESSTSQMSKCHKEFQSRCQ